MTLQSDAAHDPEIEALGPWFHNLHLPDGRQTAPDHPLGDFPSYKWKAVAPHIPQDLTGWTALDVGSNAGFYAFELARRGARVTGLEPDERYLSQARWAARCFGLEDAVSFRQGEAYDLIGATEQWDLVLFMGVLYHLRHPLLGLDAVAKVVRLTLVLQTLTMPGDERVSPPIDAALEDRQLLLQPGWPNMAFIEHRLAGDATNWWAPNAACVEAMARSSGLSIDEHPAHEIWLCSPAGGA